MLKTRSKNNTFVAALLLSGAVFCAPFMAEQRVMSATKQQSGQADAPAGNSAASASQESLKKASEAYANKDYATAMRILKPLADKNNPDAQFAVGLMYVRGDGVKQDYNMVRQYWTKASEAGNPEAQFNLGLAYIRGIFGKREPLEAAAWWEKAAAQGHGDAYYTLAQMYRNGDGVNKDKAKAAQYDQKGSEAGHPGCMYNLGMAYAKGEGVAKDTTKARELLTKSAQTGDTAAKDALKALDAKPASGPASGKDAKNTKK